MLILTVPTDDAWVDAALADLDHVLVDHAHCEMKAATSALSLAVRHPDDPALVLALTDLAKEEIEHFQRVVGFLTRRGLSLGPPPVDAYVAALRQAAHTLLRDVPALVERLLVGAMIEARSCERFKVLVDRMTAPEHAELRPFYDELFACEARHFRLYTDLARAAAARTRSAADAESLVASALRRLATAEGAIVRGLAGERPRATVHG